MGGPGPGCGVDLDLYLMYLFWDLCEGTIQGMLLLWHIIGVQEQNQATEAPRRPFLSSCPLALPLAKEIHIARPDISGQRSVWQPPLGREGSEYLLNNNPAHHMWPPGHLSFLMLCPPLALPLSVFGWLLQVSLNLAVPSSPYFGFFPFFVFPHFLGS